MKKILPLFSYIFHPLFVSIYAVLIFFYFGNSYFEYPQIYVFIVQIVIITIFIPITFYYLLHTMGKVDSIMLSDTTQRKLPLLIHVILLIILTQKSIRIDNFIELHFFFIGSLVSTILALIMVFAGFKVSLHMIGITALSIFSIGVSFLFEVRMIVLIAALFVCCGLVATSRLEMKAHTNTELILGSLTGIIPQLAMFYFWL